METPTKKKYDRVQLNTLKSPLRLITHEPDDNSIITCER